MRRGFTLVEMIVTIAIYGLVIVAVIDFARIMYTHSTQDPLALDSIDKIRLATMTFASEIRSASPGNDGSYPVAQASSTQIIFFSPFGSASSTIVNRYRYYFASSTLYKGVTAPSGTPLTYNLANEVVFPVIPNASAPSSTVFFYYNGSYDGIGTTTPITQPVNVTQVTYVQINIATKLNEVRKATSTFAIITGATIRNLKTNLGN